MSRSHTITALCIHFRFMFGLYSARPPSSGPYESHMFGGKTKGPAVFHGTNLKPEAVNGSWYISRVRSNSALAAALGLLRLKHPHDWGFEPITT